MTEGCLLETKRVVSPFGNKKMQGATALLQRFFAYLQMDAESCDPVTKAEQGTANEPGFPGAIAFQPWTE